MEKFEEALLEEKRRLEEIESLVKIRLENAPEGSLRLSTCRKKVQYYHFVSTEKKNGYYISEKNIELIRALAQKSYDIRILKVIQKKLKKLIRYLEAYDPHDIAQVYESEPEARRKFITPVEPTWEMRVQQWVAIEYQPKEFMDGIPRIVTEKGERVRSKSEKILADFFYHNNIPYKYEKPLHLQRFGNVYPDFTFLSPHTGEEIYWEHLGRMDDPTYVENAIRKIQAYEDNGFFLGEKLILTYETRKIVLDATTMKRYAQRYLM